MFLVFERSRWLDAEQPRTPPRSRKQ